MTNFAIKWNTRAHRFQLNKLCLVRAVSSERASSEKINSCNSSALWAHNFRFLILCSPLKWRATRRRLHAVPSERNEKKKTKIGEFVQPGRGRHRTALKIMLHFVQRSRSLKIPKINNNYSRRVDIFSRFISLSRWDYSIYVAAFVRVRVRVVWCIFFSGDDGRKTKTAHWLCMLARTPFLIHDLYLFLRFCFVLPSFFAPRACVFVCALAHLITTGAASALRRQRGQRYG